MDKMRKRILMIYGIVLVLGLAYTAMIHILGRGLPCMFRELTGLLCPGCGSSRMMLAAMRLDFKSALEYNPVAFFAFPLWILISAFAFAGKPQTFREGKTLGVLFAITITAYCIQCVIRNLFILGFGS